MCLFTYIWYGFFFIKVEPNHVDLYVNDRNQILREPCYCINLNINVYVFVTFNIDHSGGLYFYSCCRTSVISGLKDEEHHVHATTVVDYVNNEAPRLVCGILEIFSPPAPCSVECLCVDYV